MRSARHGLWLGAAGLLVLAVGAWLWTPLAKPEAPATVEPPVRAAPPAPAVAARAEPPRPPPRTATPPPSPAPREAQPSQPAPTAAPPVEAVVADPFEPEDGKEPHIRTLVSVGDIQLGVVRESARIRDEAGLKQVLVRIGDDLEKRVQGAEGLQGVLDTYREELGKYMDGEVELRGPGWMIGAEVGPPRPREQWWKPRAQ